MSDSAAELQAWLRAILEEAGDSDKLAHVYFPTDELLAEYLEGLNDRSEAEVKSLLRRMLGATTARADTITHELLEKALREGNYPPELELGESYYRMQRKLSYGISDTWEGMTWALDMLPFKPGKAPSGVGSIYGGGARPSRPENSCIIRRQRRHPGSLGR